MVFAEYERVSPFLVRAIRTERDGKRRLIVGSRAPLYQESVGTVLDGFRLFYRDDRTESREEVGAVTLQRRQEHGGESATVWLTVPEGAERSEAPIRRDLDFIDGLLLAAVHSMPKPPGFGARKPRGSRRSGEGDSAQE